MKILIALNHPAHYYLFKFVYKELQKQGHEVRFVIKEKDLLEKILIQEGVIFTKLIPSRKRGQGFFSIISRLGIEMVKQDFSLLRFLKSFRPDVMLGTDIAISHVGSLMKIPAIIFNEDDIEINKLFCFFTYPFATQIITPEVCNVGRFKNKQIKYNGYQKLAYLHPNCFLPDISIVQKYFSTDKPYFIIRLVSFTAGHDIEHKHGGISKELIRELIFILEQKGEVYITSEEKLPFEFEKYQLVIDPTDIHHLLFFSNLFIGDSQSMIVEAAVLGVPSIRFNSFAGKISVLNELEIRYNLTTGIKNDNPKLLLETVKKLIHTENIREVYQGRRKKMLNDKIDVSAFMIWIVENYPGSAKVMKENLEWQSLIPKSMK